VYSTVPVMETSESKPSVESQKASRAIGAMIFAFFGGAWIVLWSFRRLQNRFVALVVIAAGTMAIFLYALRCYRHYQGAFTTEVESPAKHQRHSVDCHRDRGQRLANIGLSDWVLSAAIFIVGLHFLPLARIFSNPAHSVTGSGMMLVAMARPFLASGGAKNPVGCPVQVSSCGRARFGQWWRIPRHRASLVLFALNNVVDEVSEENDQQ
jgi:hypothetical protein